MTTTEVVSTSIALSSKSLELLGSLFGEKSNLQLPVGVAEQVVEIRNWIRVNVQQQSLKE